MGGEEPGGHVLYEALLRTVARRLGGLTLIEQVSVFPMEKPEAVVASLNEQYYPGRVGEVTLELRVYLDETF